MSGLADVWGVAAGGAIVIAVGILLWRRSVLRGRRRATPDAALDTTTDIPLHHLVAIAAAVEAVIGEPHRIVGIVAPAHRVPAWVDAGRRYRPDPRPMARGPLTKWTNQL